MNIILPFLLVVLIQLAASVFLDKHWDNLRNTYSLPTASADIATLVKLTGAGLSAWILALLIGCIELHDRLRYGLAPRAIHTPP